MEDMTKYLLVRLSIRDGEREYTYQCLTNTLCDDIWFAGQRYASKFWGKSERDGDGWYAWGGEIYIKLDKVTQVSKDEYHWLNKLFN